MLDHLFYFPSMLLWLHDLNLKINKNALALCNVLKANRIESGPSECFIGDRIETMNYLKVPATLNYLSSELSIL